MSEPFIVAGRIPMSRQGFERWLATRLPDGAAVSDWDRMFTGWYWDGERVAEPPTPTGEREPETVLEWLSGRVARASAGDVMACLVRHDGAALLYYDAELLGGPPQWAERSLAVLRAAAPHASGLGFGVYWAETSGKLPRPSEVLAMCALEAAGARFIAKAELAALATSARKVLAGLAPLDALWGEYVEGFVSPGDASPNLMLPRDPRFVDPMILGRAGTPVKKSARKPPAAKQSARKPPAAKQTPAAAKPAAAKAAKKPPAAGKAPAAAKAVGKQPRVVTARAARRR